MIKTEDNEDKWKQHICGLSALENINFLKNGIGKKGY